MKLYQGNIDTIIKKVKQLMRVTLILSICFSFSLLLLVIGKAMLSSNPENQDGFIINMYIVSIISYGTFYLFIFGTIPVAIGLTIIIAYNKFNKNSAWPFIKTETILLLSSILLTSFAFLIVFFIWKENGF